MTSQEGPEAPFNWRDRLGRKVSIRYRLHGDPEHAFSEAVGVVASITSEGEAETVTIINRRGAAIVVPTLDLLAVKLFPL